jgi:hypothetical protein
VLVSVYILDRAALANICGVAEHNGGIDFWYLNPSLAERTTRVLTQAARNTLYSDTWRVNEHHLVPTYADGLLVDWQKLPDDHQLRGPAQAFQLGINKKDGAKPDGALR